MNYSGSLNLPLSSEFLQIYRVESGVHYHFIIITFTIVNCKKTVFLRYLCNTSRSTWYPQGRNSMTSSNIVCALQATLYLKRKISKYILKFLRVKFVAQLPMRTASCFETKRDRKQRKGLWFYDSYILVYLDLFSFISYSFFEQS